MAEVWDGESYLPSLPVPPSDPKGLAWVFATTTEIGCGGRSTPPRGEASPRPPYSPTRPAVGRGSVSPASRPGLGKGLGAIHFRSRPIRQVSCYTLLSGFRLPWPPPCCLYGPTSFGCFRGPFFGASAGLPVEPASPVLLTKSGPLATSPPAPPPDEAEGKTTAPLRSSRVGRGRFRPRGPRSEALRDASERPLNTGRGDPEGNFGENQLLDRSISLSPLCPPLTSDSHVSGGPGLHQGFPWLRPGKAKIAVFRVSTGTLGPHQPAPRGRSVGGLESSR